MNSPAPDVSVVLPVHDEVGNVDAEIERIRAALEASTYTYEIIVVDDGSTDGSTERLAAIPGIRLLSFATNRGCGEARRQGTMAARGAVVAWTDADMSYPNDRIPELVGLLPGHDQVVGARTTEPGPLRFLRAPAKWLIRRLASYVTATPIPDLNSGLRVFRRDVAAQFLHLLPRGFSCVTTLTMTFVANGYSVAYEPIDYVRRTGRGKFRWWADTRRYLQQVIRLSLMYEPLRVFGPAAVVAASAGVGKLVYDWAVRDVVVAASSLFVVGVGGLLLVVGFLADLVVQLNRRPLAVAPATADPPR